MNKNLFLIATVALVLVSCQTKSAPGASDQAQSSDSLLALKQLTQYYEAVIDSFKNEVVPDESRYYTSALDSLIQAADAKATPSGDVWYECDPWLQSLDYSNPAIKSIKLISYSDGEAEALVEVFPVGSDTTVYTSIWANLKRNADGVYLIDDLTDADYNYSLTGAAQNFLNDYK